MAVDIKEIEKDRTYTVNGKAVYRDMEQNWVAPDPLTSEESKAFAAHTFGRIITPQPMCAVLEEVKQERLRQNAKWGEQNHTPIEWLAILGEEVGEANKAALETHFNYTGKVDYSEYRAELIQVAAVAVSMIESLDRNQNKFS